MDCSMKKKCKEFCQFRLILPKKLYYIYIPDLGNKNIWQKKIFLFHQSFFDLEKKFTLVHLPKQAKKEGYFK